MLAHDGCRAFGAYFAVGDRVIDGVGLGCGRYAAKQIIGAKQRRNRERERRVRHLRKACKAAVVDLLVAAHLVKTYRLDNALIVKIGNVRIRLQDRFRCSRCS